MLRGSSQHRRHERRRLVRFQDNDSYYTLAGFEAGPRTNDVINLPALGITAFDALLSLTSKNSDHSVIKFSADNLIELLGASTSDLHDDGSLL